MPQSADQLDGRFDPRLIPGQSYLKAEFISRLQMLADLNPTNELLVSKVQGYIERAQRVDDDILLGFSLDYKLFFGTQIQTGLTEME
ncbi:hypothetical protein A3A66_03525 [Microgenomates group bacterium RIFCSPLOWO2_01_FULL_46_13]|nr:MAG: hypothetical protein A2783_04705 [Microgenomates group bacterium RIFCSPHIGHO2_01_FULL_45_11]OGV95056.1 MAG: hypothetical protein A3A66_03525 [Microgenomates group bacterium RIFCSPLOWO2_01_FULL_46_13]